jgi:hypothetical protein
MAPPRVAENLTGWSGRSKSDGRSRRDSVARLLRGNEPLSHDLEGRLRARQVDAIKRLGMPLMTVNIVNAGAFLIHLALTGQGSGLALGWTAVATTTAAAGLARAWRTRHRPPPDRASPRAVSKVVRSAALFGLICRRRRWPSCCR